MSGIWFINVKKINNLKNNNFDINHYFLDADKDKIQKIIVDENLDILNKECDIWIKNCKDRWISNWIALFASIFLICLGIILILIDIAIKTHHKALLVVGIICFIIGILLPFLYYFSDNWNNQFLYKWSQYLSKFKSYIINTSDLPLSLMLFYFPDLIKQNNYSSNFDFFIDIKNMQLKPSIKKYIISQINASESSWNFNSKFFNAELNEENAFRYWANIQTIYEWALFIKKLNNLNNITKW